MSNDSERAEESMSKPRKRSGYTGSCRGPEWACPGHIVEVLEMSSERPENVDGRYGLKGNLKIKWKPSIGVYSAAGETMSLALSAEARELVRVAPCHLVVCQGRSHQAFDGCILLLGRSS